MDSKANTFSYWTVVPGANVGKVPIPSRFVESTQGSERYRTVCHNDGDLKQGAKDFSLCMKHQQGTCRMGDRCHQLHVNPDFFDATKFWDEVRRTCCAKHEDFNSRSDDFLQKLNSYKFEVMGVPGSNSCCQVQSNMLARTSGLMEMIRTRPANDTRPIQFSVRQICRLHINDECRFGRDCGRIHVCRDFVNRELPLPPVPRKKGKEGHQSQMPAYGAADAHNVQAAPQNTNTSTPWMRGGGVGVNTPQAMANQPTLAQQLQQAAAVGALLQGHMAALNSIDVNKMQQQQQQQHNVSGNAFRGGFPPGVMGGGMGRPGMENPGTPLSTNAQGSLPNVVRSVVDMTLTDEAELRRRQTAAALAALGLQAQSQNLNPAAMWQQAFHANLNGKLAPTQSFAPAPHQQYQPQQQRATPFNLQMANSAPSRPLGDLTNKGNLNNNLANANPNIPPTFGSAIGGKAGGVGGVEGGERDYSMFAGRTVCPFSFDA